MKKEKWHNAFKNDLPNIKDVDEIGEIGYFGAFYPEDPNNICDDDEPYKDEDLEIDIVFYYGNNHWKNAQWEKVFVKYWMEIPDFPEEKT